MVALLASGEWQLPLVRIAWPVEVALHNLIRRQRLTLFDVGEDPQRVRRRDLDISDGVGETPDDDLIGPRIQRGQNLFAAFGKIIDVPLGITFAAYSGMDRPSLRPAPR